MASQLRMLQHGFAGRALDRPGSITVDASVPYELAGCLGAILD